MTNFVFNVTLVVIVKKKTVGLIAQLTPTVGFYLGDSHICKLIHLYNILAIHQKSLFNHVQLKECNTFQHHFQFRGGVGESACVQHTFNLTLLPSVTGYSAYPTATTY